MDDWKQQIRSTLTDLDGPHPDWSQEKKASAEGLAFWLAGLLGENRQMPAVVQEGLRRRINEEPPTPDRPPADAQDP